ncbi:MAG: TIGR04438 family Trp-rich protein [Aquabacterium sp.]|jgi:small Trp-rich protein|nr:MAG: TIGR04438 family Trp-rich protein [Aquabacterium sp.]TAL17585.1 MAG: TIGR04438 family Trp-rich protein [Aquabacterium sp.]
MWFVAIGVIFLLLKFAEIGGVQNWSWYAILAPFGLAILWWAWADATGYYQRKAMEKMDARKRERVSKNMVALGLEQRKKRRF